MLHSVRRPKNPTPSSLLWSLDPLLIHTSNPNPYPDLNGPLRAREGEEEPTGGDMVGSDAVISKPKNPWTLKPTPKTLTWACERVVTSNGIRRRPAMWQRCAGRNPLALNPNPYSPASLVSERVRTRWTQRWWRQRRWEEEGGWQ